MARELPSVGTVSYGTFTFPEAFTMRVRAQPQYDTADRSRKYVAHQLTIDTMILPNDAPLATVGGQTDTNMTALKKQLETPGLALVITDQGFGNVTIDGANVVDSRFGPKPRLLDWSSVGTNRACRIVWQCDFWLPECSDSTPLYKNAFAEFTYETSWNINDEGMTTRILRSTMEIPIARQGNGLADTADLYRQFFNPPVPVGFKRERHVQESRDKKTLDVTIIDTEIPSDNPYPAGITNIEVRHVVDSDFFNDGFVIYNSTVYGNLTLAAGVPKIQGWQAFRAIVQDRFDRGNGAVQLKGLKPEGWNHNGFALRTHLRVEESVFTRELSFEISWMYISNLTDAFQRSGMFAAVPNTNWQQWHTSLANVQGLRGIAGMGSKKTDDVIVSLCGFNYPTPNSDVNKTAQFGIDSPFSDACPPKESSYHNFKPYFQLSYETNIAQHAKLANTTVSSVIKSASTPNPGSEGYNPQSLSDNNTISASEQHKIQIRGKSIPMLVFSGVAYRYCYLPDVPTVSEWGGATPYMAYQQSRHFIVQVSPTRPLYGVVWYQVYKMNTIPNGDISTIKTTGVPEAYGPDKS